MRSLKTLSSLLLLLLIVGVWGLLLRLFLWTTPAAAEQETQAVRKFDEIDVGRLNIVGPDGKRRIILSYNKFDAPFAGEELPRNVPANFAAIIFLNPNGDEVGGIGAYSDEKQSGALSMIDYTGVPQEAIGFGREKSGNDESASFVVRDTPRRERLNILQLLREVKDNKPGAQ